MSDELIIRNVKDPTVCLGGTKEQELARSIEVLKDISGITDDEKLMYTLYFLCDSGYGNEEIKTMANRLKASGCRKISRPNIKEQPWQTN